VNALLLQTGSYYSKRVFKSQTGVENGAKFIKMSIPTTFVSSVSSV